MKTRFSRALPLLVGAGLLLAGPVFAQDGKETAAQAAKREADARAALQQLDPLWDELFPAEQARIVGLAIERVDIAVDSVNVRLRMDGLSGLAHEMLVGGVGVAA